MVLNLVTPSGGSFIKDFPARNAITCDAIDSYAGPYCLTSHSIGLYDPVLTALTSNPVLGTGGNGEIKGYYYRIWDQIYVWGYFKFGTGFSVGSGTYVVTLPFKIKNLLNFSTSIGLAPLIGNGYVWDESNTAARQPVTCQARTAQSIIFGLKMASSVSIVTDSQPITWAVDDGIKWSVRYQVDPS